MRIPIPKQTVRNSRAHYNKKWLSKIAANSPVLRDEPIKIADLGRLARVLYVDKTEIKIQSDPVRKTEPEPPKPSVKPAPPVISEAAASPAPPTRKLQPPPRPATEGQLHHLLGLMEKLGMEETAVAAEIGKPLNELTFPLTWLKSSTSLYTTRS